MAWECGTCARLAVDCVCPGPEQRIRQTAQQPGPYSSKPAAGLAAQTEAVRYAATVGTPGSERYLVALSAYLAGHSGGRAAALESVKRTLDGVLGRSE